MFYAGEIDSTIKDNKYLYFCTKDASRFIKLFLKDKDLWDGEGPPPEELIRKYVTFIVQINI